MSHVRESSSSPRGRSRAHIELSVPCIESIFPDPVSSLPMSYRGNSSGRMLLPFGLDYSDVLSQSQSTEKPLYELPVHGPLSPHEEEVAKQSLAFTRFMYDGPFYTASSQSEDTAAAEPIQRYSDRFKKVKKVGRSVDEYPYQLEFFPEELFSVMGITKQKKKLLLSSYKADGGVKQFNIEENGDDAQSMLEKLKTLAEDLDANPDQNQNNEENAEEEVDDDFDDEDEEDDDYNAEKYFEDGDDDGGDDGDDEAAF